MTVLLLVLTQLHKIILVYSSGDFKEDEESSFKSMRKTLQKFLCIIS